MLEAANRENIRVESGMVQCEAEVRAQEARASRQVAAKEQQIQDMRRQIRESRAQRAQIHHRATDNERHGSASDYFAGEAHGIGHEATGGVTLRRIADIDQMMRYACANLR